MGCDGGTIPRRDELVRTKKKPEQKDKDAERDFRWQHCALTQQRLQEPIVMCGLGRLYTKQSLIEQLLEKDKMPKTLAHIKSLKDIKTLQLTANPAFVEEDKTEGLLDARHAPYICKLIGLEMAGKFRFIALWSCGCVMSERALKEVNGGAATATCPMCQQPYSVEDVVVLNGSDDDIELMQVKCEMRSTKRKSCKKDKKEKNKEQQKKKETTSNSVEVVDRTTNAKQQEKICKQATDMQKSLNGASTSKAACAISQASVTAGASAQAAIKKKIANEKRGAAEDALLDPELKRLKTATSVAMDPKVTDVYKSLFTSHHSEKEQDRAHWITYNPFYN